MNVATSAFAFVDIAGFSAFTRERGDEAAALLAAGLAERVRALLPPSGVELVKTLGDGLMIRADDPADALRLGARLVEDARAGELPRLRVGIEAGPAINHDGDWYGATVNRAARLSDAARPGQVLVTGSVRAAAQEDGLAFRRRIGRRVRDLDCNTRVYALASRTLPDALRAIARSAGAAVCPSERAAARAAAP